MNPPAQATRALPGTVLNLGGEPLKDFLGYADLSALAREPRVGGIRFDVTGARVLSGRLLARNEARPAAVTIHARLEADEIAFLHATAFPAPQGTPVGAYEIAYADGTRERVDLVYGRDIRWWQDLSPAAAAPAGWFGHAGNDGAAAGVRVFRWRNPHPRKTIVAITLRSDHPYASPALFGVTALRAGK
jgi:hypothetical protein